MPVLRFERPARPPTDPARLLFASQGTIQPDQITIIA
jgi:hypothetical protein